MTVKWRWLKLIIVNDHYRKEYTHTHTAVPHLEEPRQPLRSERDQLQTWLLVRPQTWRTPAWLQQCLQGWFIVSQLIQKQEKVARPSYGNKRNNVESDKTASAVLRGTACLSFPTLSCLLPQRDIFMFHRNFLAFSARLYACIEFYVTPSKQSYHRRSCFARWGLIFGLSNCSLARQQQTASSSWNLAFKWTREQDPKWWMGSVHQKWTNWFSLREWVWWNGGFGQKRGRNTEAKPKRNGVQTTTSRPLLWVLFADDTKQFCAENLSLILVIILQREKKKYVHYSWCLNSTKNRAGNHFILQTSNPQRNKLKRTGLKSQHPQVNQEVFPYPVLQGS